MVTEGRLCSRCKRGHYRYGYTGVHGYNGVWSPLLRGEYDVYVCDNCGHKSFERVRR